MHSMIRAASMALCLGLSPVNAMDKAPPLSWVSLVDEAAQDFEDPYRDLTADQLNDLMTIVRLRSRLESASVAAEARPLIQERLEQKSASLANAAIDVDWLIEQRWMVAERRKTAALAGNKALDGAEVALAGFLIPAPPAADGTPTAYLVPERGMCSHMPPPPPNQLLQLRVPEGYKVPFLYTPVIVRGTVELIETQRSVFVVDGPVPMWSAWTMEAASLEQVALQTSPSDMPLAHQSR